MAVTLNLTLIPLWGLAGAATAWAAAVLTDCLLATVQVYGKLGIRPRPYELLPVMALAAGTPALGALGVHLLWGNQFLGLIIYLVVVVPLYAALIYRFRQQVGLEQLINSLTRKFRR